MMRAAGFFFCLILIVLIGMPTVSAEELLWCSGSKATSPLCVEFNQALESRARADELKNFLSEIDKPPWSPESYETAIDLYGKARAQFNDEYFGDSAQLYLDAVNLFEPLQLNFQASVEDKKNEVLTAKESRRFKEALTAITNLENWSLEDFSKDRLQIQAMIRDEKRIDDAGVLLAANDFLSASKLLDGLETTAFDPEKKRLVRKLTLMATKEKFSRLVRSAFNALEHKNYGSARSFFLEAKKIDPSSVTVLSNLVQLDKLEKSLEIERLKSDLKKFLGNESYVDALMIIEKLEPLDASFKLGEDYGQLRAVVELEARIDQLAPQLKSLSSSRLRKTLEDLFETVESKGLTEFGLRFAKKYGDLRARYVKLSKKKAFNIRSDGKSRILVRPGGNLGQFKEMTLKVYPGKYSLIARCAGLKEKIVEVNVVADDEAMRAEYIACL